MSETWYRPNGGKVEAHEVIRSTEKCLYFQNNWHRNSERRENKGKYWFATEAEAIDCLIRDAKENAEYRKRILDRALEHLEKVRTNYPDHPAWTP